MNSKILTTFTVLLIGGAIVAVAGWLGGSEVAGGTLLMIGIGLGAWYGATWGGKEATKTHEYREAWLYGDEKNRITKGEKNKPDSNNGP